MTDSPFVTTIRHALDAPPTEMPPFLAMPHKQRVGRLLGQYTGSARVLQQAQEQESIRAAQGHDKEYFGHRAIAAERAHMLEMLTEISNELKAAGVTVATSVFTAEKKRLRASKAA